MKKTPGRHANAPKNSESSGDLLLERHVRQLIESRRFLVEHAGSVGYESRHMRALLAGVVNFDDPSDAWDPARAIKDGTQRVFGEYGGVNPAIEASTTFTTMHPATMEKMFRGKKGAREGCYLYSRHFNPNCLEYGSRVAAMEDMESGYTTSSGMAAIQVVLNHLTKEGGHIVSGGAIYGGTHATLKNEFPKRGVHTTFVRPSDTEGFRRAMRKNTKVVYVETEANPTLEIADLKALSDMAHERGAKLVVDNTFSPLTFTAAHHGADMVVHSATKFLGGHSDSLGGVICCPHDFLLELMDLNQGGLMLSGPVMDPKIAHQFDLYLNSLPLRIQEHSRRANLFAHRLESMGVPVRYPGLDSHPQHRLATAMMNPKYGYGGLLSIDFGNLKRAKKFVDTLQKYRGGLNAVSLGYFDTLVSISGSTTSSEIEEAHQQAMGLTPGLVRLSIGYTGNAETEWGKLERSMEKARKV